MARISRNQWIDLFDRVAPEYDQVVPFFSAFAVELIDWIELPPGADLLDLATGRGAIAAAALAAEPHIAGVTGVDASPQMIALTSAQLRDSRASFAVMDAEELAFDGESFDIVTCGFAMHLLDHPDRALAEVFRVLRPGGVFAFSVPGRSDGSAAKFFDDLRREFAARLPPAPEDRSKLEPESMLSAAGFVGLETTAVEVRLPVDSPEDYWNGERSHGFRAFFDRLSPAELEAFRERLFAFLEGEQRAGGIFLDRGARFFRASKPGRA